MKKKRENEMKKIKKNLDKSLFKSVSKRFKEKSLNSLSKKDLKKTF